MAIKVGELKDWLRTLADEAEMGIDGRELILIGSQRRDCFDVGGVPKKDKKREREQSK